MRPHCPENRKAHCGVRNPVRVESISFRFFCLDQVPKLLNCSLTNHLTEKSLKSPEATMSDWIATLLAAITRQPKKKLAAMWRCANLVKVGCHLTSVLSKPGCPVGGVPNF